MKRTLQRMYFLRFTCILVNLLFTTGLWAQSPYSIAPKWYFGTNAGMSFPTSGAPSVLLGGQTGFPLSNQECSSTMCDPAGNVIFYTDGYRLFDGNHTLVRTFNGGANGGCGGTSSTNSSICFPDPANPTTDFYLVTANQDPTGGGHFPGYPSAATSDMGIYYYRIHKTGPGTITVTNGGKLANNNEVTEQLHAGSDGNGGYWIVTHQGGGSNGNQIWSWNFTASGVGSKQISSVAGTENNISYNGSMKINKCQTKLAAIYRTGKVEVFDWDKTTGKVTGAKTCPTSAGFGYGCEFSPDGNILYFTNLISQSLYQWDLTTDIVTTISTVNSNSYTEMGTLQIGPDDKIYVDNVAWNSSPVYIGVINNPNVSGTGCNYSGNGFTLSSGSSPTIYRGIANEAWINPTHTISSNGTCMNAATTFGYLFQTYFGQNVGIVANSQQWDFGDGGGLQSGLGATPSHTYTSAGTYTVTMKVTDNTCNTVWTTTTQVTIVNCGCPNDAVAPTSINPISALCTNDAGNITLHANGGSGLGGLEWYEASCASTPIGTGNDLVIASPTSTTTYFVRWLADGVCANSACISLTVNVSPLPTDPTAANVNRNNFCDSDAGNISLSATGGSGDNLVWYTSSCGGTQIGTGTPLVIASPSTSTTYYARWESNLCPASNCQSVTVTPVPAPTPSISGITSSCATVTGSPFSTTDNSGSGNTYVWSSTGGVTLTGSTTTAATTADIGTAAGTISVTEIAGTCSTTVSRSISITPATTLASVGPDVNSCVTTYTLNGNAPGVGTGQWLLISGSGTFTDDSDNTTSINGLSNGANVIVWRITGTCGIDDDTLTITVGGNSLTAQTIASTDTVCFGSPKDIQAIVAGGSGNYTYVWSSSDNSFNFTTTSSTVTINPASLVTVYHVNVIDNQNIGCNASDNVNVYAVPDQELVMPNLITPNGDNKNDYLEIKDINELHLLPGASLEIVNRWGDRVYDNSNYDNTWNAPNISDGIYYYHLKTGCGNRVYKGWVQIIH